MTSLGNCDKFEKTGCCYLKGSGHCNIYITSICGCLELVVNCDLCLIDIEIATLNFLMFDFEIRPLYHSNTYSNDVLYFLLWMIRYLNFATPFLGSNLNSY